MRLLIKKGRYINPPTGADIISDVLVTDGIVTKVATDINEDADEIIDAAGCIVVPGFIDLHVHLREPGFEHKETIKTGARSAAKGGYTTICAMPNTKPVIDSGEMIEWINKKAEEDACVNVLPIGAVTKGQNGTELAEILEMKEKGACAISEDGKSVMDAELYKKAMVIAAQNSIPVFAHCEEITLVKDVIVNNGKISKQLGVKGVGNEVEDIITDRDIKLAKETGARLHLCHCSTKDSVKMVADAKKDGQVVSAEVCPHHFTLTEDDIVDLDTNYKMNPPLRTREDVDELLSGIKSGIIEVISTDHAPHTKEEKSKSFAEAPCGIVGLETALSLSFTKLVKTGLITLSEMVAKMSSNPAKILGIEKGDISEGKTADITIFEAEDIYSIDVKTFASKSNNSPFDGMEVYGKVKYTIVEGNIIYGNGGFYDQSAH